MSVVGPTARGALFGAAGSAIAGGNGSAKVGTGIGLVRRVLHIDCVIQSRVVSAELPVKTLTHVFQYPRHIQSRYLMSTSSLSCH
ncbi:hypothetical protein [Vibrio salilacus]|uniref:hypothetical protein n=1 Tax=Vibrio salilacus TaxID=1323749 RepID=UPI000C296E24|nr:hypothetical protein [Vibrio salilacus]